MAHYAELDDSNVVLRVIVVSNESCKDKDGNEKEAIGEFFCKTLFGPETNWKQTSYHGAFRKNFAGVGYSYDPILDIFIPPSPYSSWVFDSSTLEWVPPVVMPTDGAQYIWSENSKNWVKE